MPNKDRAYSVRISPQIWEDRKEGILALYKTHILYKVLEKITTAEFSPSESQLRDKLKEWGSKKKLSSKERKKINREIEQRNLPIERCDVIVHGEVQPSSKTLQEFTRTCNRSYRGLSPGLPGHIQIRTSPTIMRSWAPAFSVGKAWFRSRSKTATRLAYTLAEALWRFYDQGGTGTALLDNTYVSPRPLDLSGTHEGALMEALNKYHCFSYREQNASLDQSSPLYDVSKEGIKISVRHLGHQYRNSSSEEFGFVDNLPNLVPLCPLPGRFTEEREDAGITTEEPTREGWETLVNWDG